MARLPRQPRARGRRAGTCHEPARVRPRDQPRPPQRVARPHAAATRGVDARPRASASSSRPGTPHRTLPTCSPASPRRPTRRTCSRSWSSTTADPQPVSAARGAAREHQASSASRGLGLRQRLPAPARWPATASVIYCGSTPTCCLPRAPRGAAAVAPRDRLRRGARHQALRRPRAARSTRTRRPRPRRRWPAARSPRIWDWDAEETHKWVEGMWRRTDDLTLAGPRAFRALVGATVARSPRRSTTRPAVWRHDAAPRRGHGARPPARRGRRRAHPRARLACVAPRAART